MRDTALPPSTHSSMPPRMGTDSSTVTLREHCGSLCSLEFWQGGAVVSSVQAELDAGADPAATDDDGVPKVSPTPIRTQSLRAPSVQPTAQPRGPSETPTPTLVPTLTPTRPEPDHDPEGSPSNQRVATRPAGDFYVAADLTGISSGSVHSCGLRSDGTVVCWGRDWEGQSSEPEGEFAAMGAYKHYSCGAAQAWWNRMLGAGTPSNSRPVHWCRANACSCGTR